MLFPSEETMRRRGEIAHLRQQGELTDLEAGTQMIEADPDSPGGYLLLANARQAEGDMAGAEAYGWQAMERQPCDPGPYLSVSEFRRKSAPDELVAMRLIALGFWKVSFREEVPPRLAELFQAHLPDTKVDFGNPAEYGRLATAFDDGVPPAAPPDDRLLPYLWLNEMEIQAEVGLDRNLLGRMLEHSDRMLPLWTAALRQWRRHEESPRNDALSMMIALLGEAAGPEFISDVLDLVDSPHPNVFQHANWALWRLGQRFPAEALQAFAALSGAGARVAQLCAAAEHIGLLPPTPGRADIVIGLLEGFQEFAGDVDAPVLLAAVVWTLEHVGHAADSGRILGQFRTFLDQDASEWLDAELEAGSFGRLEEAQIEGFTIEDVCVHRALLDIDDLDETDEEDNESEDLDDFDDIPELFIAPARPGRNDPCWCGSGKKYKKCHLAADEEADRSRG